MWRSHRRHRWQASSHRIPVHPQKQAGWQAAIADKTAPTRFRYLHKNRPAIRPPSLAKQLPQDSGTSTRTGRLAGRHRWQNSSHKIPVHPQERAGWQAAIAGRPAPTGFRYIRKNRSAGRPPSLAGQLPQGSGASAEIGSAVRPPSHAMDQRPPPTKPRGRALARLALLILIHPPLREAEWRCSSGEWRAAPFDAVEHAACRSSRSRPEGSVPG